MHKLPLLPLLIVATTRTMAQAPIGQPADQPKIENVCARNDVQKALLQAYNEQPILTKEQGRIVSMSGIATRRVGDHDLSCHADYHFDSGVSKPMTFSFEYTVSKPPSSSTASQPRARSSGNTLGFDPAETCGQIMRGQDYQGAFDQLHAEEVTIEADIQATYRALAETDMRLAQNGLTAKQIATNRSIRDAQAKHIDFQKQLVHHLYLVCPPYINNHRFDGR